MRHVLCCSTKRYRGGHKAAGSRAADVNSEPAPSPSTPSLRLMVSPRFEQGMGDQASVSACTVDVERLVLGQLVHVLDKGSQADVQCAVNVLCCKLAVFPYVQHANPRMVLPHCGKGLCIHGLNVVGVFARFHPCLEPAFKVAQSVVEAHT